MAVNNGLKRTTTKIFKVETENVGTFETALLAGCGDSAFINQMVDWYRRGAKPEDYPAQQRDKDDWQTIAVFKKGEFIEIYERTPFPVIIEDVFFACGSGRDFALGAMACGKTAREAIEIAAQFDCGTGMGIDTLEFNE